HQALDTGGAKHEAVFTTADTLIAITMQATEDHPNLDFGLVVLAKALDLPDHAPFSLFALGRTAGWIGHILEQYELDRLIRPRAQYTGVQPRR
ncbi:citrate synthase, partial [Candidatus Saccharibacteria bacterium]|nr:citrate synthase [Candidatus Saccharibacteria bacterium]